MIDSTASRRDGHTAVPSSTAAPSPAEVRAERRRLIESIRALRRLLDKRRAFEVADRRRLNREARDRLRAEAAHGRTLRRVHEKQTRKERSLTRRLNGLDGKRESQERQALAVLRRESIERSLNSTRLTASEVNGIGSGLVRALAAQGIGTAADFKRVSWGKAPNGRGGEVLYIHRTHGGKVHINGIGEHRGRPLMEWRRAAVARAEARAPRELPSDERHRIAEIIEAERTRLREELAQAPRTAEAARTEAVRLHTEALAHLTATEREAARLAAERRAEFDTMAEQLLALQAELSAHMDQYGDAGRRIRRAQSRALRPVPALPAIPAPRTPDAPQGSPHTPDAAHKPTRRPVDLTKTASTPATRTPAPATTSAPAFAVRASLGWLLPILYFGLTTVVGVGELGENTAPLWLMITSRLLALAATAELLRLWIPRRSWRTPSPMPSGTGPQAFGVFLSLTAAGMFADEKSDIFVIACVTSVLAAFLLVSGTGLRMNGPQAGKGGNDATSSS
ncbi:hypothetical protein [Streptomyces sp. NEAU-NA10]|uniref:hypothetical protein n=1 Tax=Streptomyces sp. NEAU-NA10 TaxID=3416050 RepID=UPI003CC55264